MRRGFLALTASFFASSMSVIQAVWLFAQEASERDASAMAQSAAANGAALGA
jgi:hypothetical protein